MNPHFHSIFVDVAYRDDGSGKPVFVATPTIDKKSADRLLTRIVAQVLKLLRRRVIISADQWLAPEEIAPDAQLTLEAMRLFRYVLRPAIAASSLANDSTRVTFCMKRTLSGGQSVLHFTQQAFIRRNAQLVPRPRQHEIVYFGLFAANAKDRTKVVRVATHRKRSKKDPTTQPRQYPPCLGPSCSGAHSPTNFCAANAVAAQPWASSVAACASSPPSPRDTS